MQRASFEFAAPRQPVVNHAARIGPGYVPLTSLFKPITTALWHGRDNRAATARWEPKFSGRQMEAGRIAAGSGRDGPSHRTSAVGMPLRLDPFSLPVRFEAADAAADERLRIVDLHRERVVLRRSVAGMRMALNLPVAAFRGVAIRLFGDAGSGRGDSAPTSIAVVLEHQDPALSLPLYASPETDDIVAEWQAWGRVLGLPLLVAESDGTFREPFARLGAVRIEAPTCRRRRRTAIARRHPSRLLRRRSGTLPPAPIVHRDEREIIARN
jgi:Family of unknown function (DUF6101)